ncbi:porin [Ferrimonas senticii]|uniref:porin n=1 Tax=Ferrimonas senticii TaxID=394566 RepID=UPI000417AC99|nr:porin [Ferrimonas senticii]
MMKPKYLAVVTAMVLSAGAQAASVNNVAEMFQQGSVKLDANLRYENVQQDNALKDADALTLRTRLTFETAELHGFSALLEFEDSRDLFGINDYSDGTGNGTDYSVIADPNTTEVDQAAIRYSHQMGKVTVGRQVVALDNQRFVGHVGWRQDRQTFDAVNLLLTPMADLSLNYIYINQRNRIFGDEQDIDANDHLFNLGYQTDFGKLSGYAYLLDNDKVENDDLNTYGVRFAGASKMSDIKLNYQLEYATQENEANDADTDYYLVEVGAGMGAFGAKVGYEVLGSDNGKVGFSTPLATLHKFNGWTDTFLGTPDQGLQDLYVGLTAKTGYGAFAAVYHDFSSDYGSIDYGSEVDLQFTTKFGKHYNAGIKYAMYDADDFSVDTDKLWVWVGASF